MTTDNFCFYLQNRLIQKGQTGGQLYSNTSPFSFPWLNSSLVWQDKLGRLSLGSFSRYSNSAEVNRLPESGRL
jgi:hypothetical protein